MKVVLICDFLNQWGGAERVLLALCNIFPKAPIYTLIYNPQKTLNKFSGKKIITSPLQKNPLAHAKPQWFINQYQKAIESFNLEGFDLIISSSSAFAKGIKKPKGAVHICYCHTPMRYSWDWTKEYIKEANIKNPLRTYVNIVIHKLRLWDQKNSQNVDLFIANSTNVKKRIAKYYKKEAVVIYPPVDTKKFIPWDNKKENYFLHVGRLSPYKKLDLVIDAFHKLGLPLKVVGEGKEKKKQQKTIHKNIEFTGQVSDEKLVKLYQRAKALIFGADEDFGLVPVEAIATGTPVIAYKKGGVLESVIEGVNGLFFDNQTKESLIKAVQKFLKSENKFNQQKIIESARKFNQDIFEEKIRKVVKEFYEKAKNRQS